MRLEGKVALVTGAGRGIGKALALAFAHEGANIVAASRTRAEIEATAREVEALGRESLAFPADVSREEDVAALAAAAKRFGRLDVLVNNAALRMNHLGRRDSYLIRLEDLSIEDWDRTIAVNLRGPFLCTKFFLPLLKKAGAASIINISAGGGKRGMAGRLPYCASKFGLEGMTQSLAAELKADNIAVNSLSPGAISILTDREKIEELKKNPAALFMRPDIMAPPALFLARQDGNGVTGTHIEALHWIRENGLGDIEDWRATI
ncbi:MAG TPA: SDR family oxidoreductase [Candidatus Binatia bacterium]|jgi:3-oxoacyl-[acyl-carrier protein] reductase